MEKLNPIIGANLLTNVFGDWPSFHDAEVWWIRLERQVPITGTGATLEAMVHTFEITNEVGENGSYILKQHVLVHFRFQDIVRLNLKDFNHQNSLLGLNIVNIKEWQLEQIGFEVSFVSANGVDAQFQCRAVEVVSVTPCDNEGNPVG